MKNTFEVNGISYVGAREIERHYNLCKSKAWRLLSASGIATIIIANTFFYPSLEVAELMKNNNKK